MILELVQKNKDLFAAQFVIKRAAEQIGEASLQGRMGSMEAAIRGTFYNIDFEMTFDRRNALGKKMFRPYLLKQGGMEVGSVYQTIHKEGMFKSYEYHHMVKDGMLYDLFPIGFGDEGGKCPIYLDCEQIAQVEKDCVVYNDLHNYRIFAADENAAFIAVLFCMYMYVNACYRPGEKAVSSKVKSVSVTTNKLLKEKYNPYFKDGIAE